MSVTALARFLDHRLADRVSPGPGTVGSASGSGTGQFFPVRDELRALLPWPGLRRGATVAVAGGPGATSVLLALLAGPVGAGSWCGVLGVPALGAEAAAESGIDLGRLALVPDPGTEWATVTAALLDGLDIVAVRPPGPVAARLSRRLAARARQRGCVLVPYGEWDGADVVLRAAGQVWHGLGAGRGRLRSRTLDIVSDGRGAAARTRKVTLWQPSGGSVPDGNSVQEIGSVRARSVRDVETAAGPPLALIPDAGSGMSLADTAVTEAS